MAFKNFAIVLAVVFLTLTATALPTAPEDISSAQRIHTLENKHGSIKDTLREIWTPLSDIHAPPKPSVVGTAKHTVSSKRVLELETENAMLHAKIAEFESPFPEVFVEAVKKAPARKLSGTMSSEKYYSGPYNGY